MIKNYLKYRTKKLIEAAKFYDEDNPQKFLVTDNDFFYAGNLRYNPNNFIKLHGGFYKQPIIMGKEEGVDLSK